VECIRRIRQDSDRESWAASSFVRKSCRVASATEADKGLVDKTLEIENCEMLKSTLRTHFIIIRLLIRVRARTYLE
jgi:hypothetical protein